MKKSRKKIVIGLVIILIFGMSSIAFVATSLVQPQQSAFEPLESPYVFGEIDSVYEQTYVANGFTWVKFYRTTANDSFIDFVRSLPQVFTVPGGQFQMVLQELDTGYNGEENFIYVASPSGQESFSDMSEDKVMDALCRRLTITPFECTLRSIEDISDGNQTNSTGAS